MSFLFLVKQGRLGKQYGDTVEKRHSCWKKPLKNWPKGEWIYLGSICDPLMSGSPDTAWTEQCLKIIDQYQIPLLITTSAVSPALLEEAEILKNMKAPVVIVTELAKSTGNGAAGKRRYT